MPFKKSENWKWKDWDISWSSSKQSSNNIDLNILLIHGFGASKRHWRHNQDFLGINIIGKSSDIANYFSDKCDEVIICVGATKDTINRKEIYEFLTDRYGDFILLKPAFKLNTLALWLLPFIFVLVGIFIVFFHNKKSKKI